MQGLPFPGLVAAAETAEGGAKGADAAIFGAIVILLLVHNSAKHRFGRKKGGRGRRREIGKEILGLVFAIHAVSCS